MLPFIINKNSIPFAKWNVQAQALHDDTITFVHLWKIIYTCIHTSYIYLYILLLYNTHYILYLYILYIPTHLCIYIYMYGCEFWNLTRRRCWGVFLVFFLSFFFFSFQMGETWVGLNSDGNGMLEKQTLEVGQRADNWESKAWVTGQRGAPGEKQRTSPGRSRRSCPTWQAARHRARCVQRSAWIGWQRVGRPYLRWEVRNRASSENNRCLVWEKTSRDYRRGSGQHWGPNPWTHLLAVSA